MGISDLYGPADEAESIATIHAALDAGLTLLDTGDFYAGGHNELLRARALEGRNRHEVAISATKQGGHQDAQSQSHYAEPCSEPSRYRGFEMAKLQRRPFGEADDVRAVPMGRLETYDLGELRVGRSILEPGWRWSESVKPIARTDWCEFHHIGLCIGGACRITMREGAEIVITAGQFYEVPPFHDAEVIGDEPYVTVDWNPSAAFAQSEGGGFDRIVATLLMTDIVDSTVRARQLGDARWRDLLGRHNMVVRGLLQRFRGREVTTTGDGFVAIFDGAERAIRAAQEIGRALSELALEVRAGVHTGELELEGDDVRGLNVHIAARIMALAGPGEVYASWATRELLAGSSVSFVDRGLHELKGLADQRRMYLVEPSLDS